ncbi:alpha-mannosidase 2x-like [Mercenaria mercenaria]|uniref:alpha-mannosidase 2x-like n=1 Tax=Mercenaria mercenaria TaxID=6596 RepID=UPI00234E4202|nr:alpha-mannosidase 2x-like [Mercenaria mercenaria]
MSIGRYICRKRRFLKIVQFFILFFFFRVIQISFFTTNEFDGNSIVFIKEFNKTFQKESKRLNTFQNPSLDSTNHADLYTYDLPDITSYEFVSGKRFKEYVIPVKDEKVAYGPNLDPLEVLLIPFSHVDPGYGLTLENYYQRMSKHTLNNMVTKLEQYSDLTFQWAETIFLERWWRDISDDMKTRVRALIQNGRLEILSGGWVMPDEAVTHYSPVIDQLIEGHQWLWENLGVMPKNNWANDPFGYSSTYPYIWKKSGMENMVILRINQAIKATLMKKQALEFIWKPLWSTNSSNDILCHLMPYRGYWIGDTCGPYNQHICREYAFMHTNPKDKVVFVTEQNVAERARILYEQYRITAEVYRRDNLNAKNESVSQNLYLPIFLGEDFSYVHGKDYDLIYDNYKRLFKYMNAKREWNINLKFGTIAEYFEKIKANQEKRTAEDGSRFSKLSGDFLPYTDYQNDYWTGYYSTRPFIKHLSRELQNTLKMADIFHSYAHAHAQTSGSAYSSYAEVTALLRDARRDLGMFLHHDGITGTSVLPVIQDFRLKIFVALSKAKRAMKLITAQLLTLGNLPGLDVFKDTIKRSSMTSIPEYEIMNLSTNFKVGGSFLVVANPSVRKRRDVVSFAAKSKDKYTFISSAHGSVEFQTQAINDDTHRYLFSVELPPLSIKTFRIEAFKTKKDMNATYEEDVVLKQPEINIQNEIHAGDRDKLFLENTYLYVEIDNDSGFPKRMKIKDDEDSEIDVFTQVLAYSSLRSGAYIFAPDGNAKQYLYSKPAIVVSKGPVVSEIKSIYASFMLITRVYNVTGIKGMGVHITTEFDMTKERKSLNKELVLRFQTSVDNRNIFYTDQNSFQLIGRKTRANRLIEENYYPITSMMVIEDSKKRLTLHTAQPHGAASLRNGWMEVMLDRRVTRDDDKGLGQGVTDNVLTVANFVLQVDTRTRDHNELQEFRYTFPSESNLLMNEILNEPTYSLFVEEGKRFREFDLNEEVLEFSTFKDSLPCGVLVAGMRILAKSDLTYNGTSLVLHYKPTLSGLKENIVCGNRVDDITLRHMYPGIRIKSAKETSLTHLHEFGETDLEDNLRPADMELRSFKLMF